MVGGGQYLYVHVHIYMYIDMCVYIHVEGYWDRLVQGFRVCIYGSGLRV